MSASRVVVGEHRAAVAVAAERLGRKEAGRGRWPKRAELAALVGRAEALRGVVEHEQVFRLGDGRDRVVVGRQAEQIDRDHRLRLQARPLGGRDRARRCPSASMLKVVRIDIDEHRRRADQRHDFGGGAEREGRADHRVARADPLAPSAPAPARRCRWRS